MTTETSTKGQEKYYVAIAAAVVAVLVALWLLFKPQAEVVELQAEVPAKTEQLTVPEPEPILVPEKPVSVLPEETVEPELTVVEDIPLPALDESDQQIKQELLSLNWQPGLAALFVTDQMVRNFVVQVDNIAHGQLVKGHNVLQPLEQRFIGTKQPPYQLDPANFSRYEPYLTLLESVSASELLASFERFEPLAAEAFAELGYPDASFKQRLLTAIDVLLQTPEVTYPITLERPSVMYKFADPKLEALPAPQKMMLRMGPDNQKRFKQILRQYRTELQQ